MGTSDASIELHASELMAENGAISRTIGDQLNTRSPRGRCQNMFVDKIQSALRVGYIGQTRQSRIMRIQEKLRRLILIEARHKMLWGEIGLGRPMDFISGKGCPARAVDELAQAETLRRPSPVHLPAKS